jgi:methionyl-tRNA formyltransferase
VTEQDLSTRSYYGRPKDADYLLDFSQEAAIIRRHTRAGYRKPGAYALCPGGDRVVILTVAPTDGVVPGPLERPGAVRVTDRGVFVAARDEWLRVVTVEEEGAEIPVEAARAVWTDGANFALPEPSLA